MIETSEGYYFILTLDKVKDSNIIEGLKTGKYTQIGGVIRDSVNKQIVAHLRDVGDPSIIKEIFQNSQLAHIANLQYLNLGLGVMNLSATAISTLYLAKRINDIEKKLNEILNKLEEIAKDVETIKKIVVYKNLLTALNRYKNIHTFRNPDLINDELKNIRNHFEEALSTFYIVLNTIKEEPNITNEFIHFVRLYIIATEGLAKTYLDLNEINAAYSKYEDHIKNIKEFNSLFIELGKNYRISFPPEIRIELKNNVISTKFIEGRMLELEYIDKKNISFPEWKKLTDGREDNIYVIVEK